MFLITVRMGVIPHATTLPPQLRTGPVVIASMVSSSIGSSVTTPPVSSSTSTASSAPTVTSNLGCLKTALRQNGRQLRLYLAPTHARWTSLQG